MYTSLTPNRSPLWTGCASSAHGMLTATGASHVQVQTVLADAILVRTGTAAYPMTCIIMFKIKMVVQQNAARSDKPPPILTAAMNAGLLARLVPSYAH